jgi:hypothetical protein
MSHTHGNVAYDLYTTVEKYNHMTKLEFQELLLPQELGCEEKQFSPCNNQTCINHLSSMSCFILIQILFLENVGKSFNIAQSLKHPLHKN